MRRIPVGTACAGLVLALLAVLGWAASPVAGGAVTADGAVVSTDAATGDFPACC
ncbi:hypothetical protein [Streptomyces sp. NRRL B-24484]|uniref:hypothetical protein n=1 Tax=Streptomyces sp. NRRL B-24484 TaxID=1463833 RepID=UPI000AFBCBC7|nr:hypothetical protein [Streptomyces sp. NRRL B-24484]